MLIIIIIIIIIVPWVCTYLSKALALRLWALASFHSC